MIGLGSEFVLFLVMNLIVLLVLVGFMIWIIWCVIILGWFDFIW